MERISLDQDYPALISEWHPDNPPINTTTKGSTKKFKWVCSENHVWSQSPNVRLGGLRSPRGRIAGCPICSGRNVLTGVNDVATTHPHLVDEWDIENTKNPSQVKTYSNKKIMWVCRYGHRWSSSLSNRTNNGSGCPDCAGKNKSSAELRALCSFSRFGEVRTGVPVGGGKVDIYLPQFSTAAEYDGEYYHRNTLPCDHTRTLEILGAGVRVIRLREQGLQSLKIDNPNYLEIFIDPTNNQDSLNSQIVFESIKDFLQTHHP